MMIHQILLVISGLLLGALILSLYFVMRSRTQAHRVRGELKDVRKELKISKEEIGHYRDLTDRAESKLENACKQVRLANDARKTAEDMKISVERELKKKQDALEKMKNNCKILRRDLDNAQRLIDRYRKQDQSAKEKEDACEEFEGTKEKIESDSESAWCIETRKEFAKEFLDSLDSFELGLIHANKQGSAQVDGIVDGMNLALKKLKGAVRGLGIEIFDPKGKFFDPGIHRSIGMQESEGVAPGIVLFVARKGCLFNGQIMRFADVIIAK